VGTMPNENRFAQEIVNYFHYLTFKYGWNLGVFGHMTDASSLSSVEAKVQPLMRPLPLPQIAPPFVRGAE